MRNCAAMGKGARRGYSGRYGRVAFRKGLVESGSQKAHSQTRHAIAGKFSYSV